MRPPGEPQPPPTVGRRLVGIAVVAGVYFLAGRLGLSLTFVHASASPVWPPTGLALAAILVLGNWVWPAFFLGAFSFNLMTAGNVPTSLAIGLGNTLEALVGAYLVRRFANGRRAFERVPDMLKFVFLAAGLATTLSATIGVSALTLAGFAPSASFGLIWLTWWLGDAGGAVVVAPALIVWSEHLRRRQGSWAEYRGVVLLALLAVATSAGSFIAPFGAGTSQLVLFMALLVLLLVAALRTGALGATALLVIIGAFSVWGTLHGTGPFASASENEALLMLDLFLVSTNVGTLGITAAASAQRTRGASDERVFGEGPGG